MSASLFPIGIWDGTTDGRPDLAVVQSPTHHDWRRMLHELEAVQRYVLNLSGNAVAMPSLGEDIAKAAEKVENMLDVLSELTPPVEMEAEVKQLHTELVGLQRSHVRITSSVKKLLIRMRTAVESFKKLETEVATQIEAIRHSVRNQLASHARQMEVKQHSLQKQIDELHEALTDTDI